MKQDRFNVPEIDVYAEFNRKEVAVLIGILGNYLAKDSAEPLGVILQTSGGYYGKERITKLTVNRNLALYGKLLGAVANGEILFSEFVEKEGDDD